MPTTNINPTLELTCKALGKHCRIVVENDDEQGEKFLTLATAELRRIEEKFCGFQENSLIAKINRRAGLEHPTPLDEESISLIKFLDAMHEKSNGKFDPTIESNQILAKVDRSIKNSDHCFNEALSSMGWRLLKIQDSTAELTTVGAKVLLNSCITSYSLDCIRKKLVMSGAKHGLMEFGKNASTIGKQPDDSNWLIGLRYSAGAGGGISRIKLNNQSLAVCGKIENSVVLDGERFSGAIDPDSRQLIPGVLVSAVEAHSALEAYSAAKMSWVLPEKDGIDWLNSLGLRYFALDRNLKIHGELYPT